GLPALRLRQRRRGTGGPGLLLGADGPDPHGHRAARAGPLQPDAGGRLCPEPGPHRRGGARGRRQGGGGYGMTTETQVIKLTMPKWGLSMTEGRLVSWLVEEGSTIRPGDEVAEVETEKINGVVEAPAGGILRRRVAEPGQVIPVGGMLGIIADEATP